MAEKYVEMWKNLGMDIEKHNQLLNILGQYYTACIFPKKTDPKKWITSTSSSQKFTAYESKNSTTKEPRQQSRWRILHLRTRRTRLRRRRNHGRLMRRRRLLSSRRRSCFAPKPLPLNQVVLRLQTQPNMPILPIQ